jgi:hypothetical protein
MLREVSVDEFRDLHRAAALLSDDPKVFGWVESALDVTMLKTRMTYFILLKRFRQWAVTMGKLKSDMTKAHRLREAGFRVIQRQSNISDASAQILEKAGGFRSPSKDERSRLRGHAWVIVVERR